GEDRPTRADQPNLGVDQYRWTRTGVDCGLRKLRSRGRAGVAELRPGLRAGIRNGQPDVGEGVEPLGGGPRAAGRRPVDCQLGARLHGGVGCADARGFQPFRSDERGESGQVSPLGIILIVLLVVLVFGGFAGRGNYGASPYYTPGLGLIGLLLLVFLILVLV